jgi:pimeloyl-ACP methyl ester carboxylesterase
VNATDQPAGVKPTIVLVHGAFADASSWNGVIERLQQQGYTVIAPANPLRGLAQYKYPAGPDGETAVELAVNPALFREAFAADLPAETVALMAATQRPTAVTAFSEASGPPAWKKLPCWTVVATGDKAAGADVIRSEAQRAGADITEVEGSHVIMISQPQAVTDVIVTAARAVADTRR